MHLTDEELLALVLGELAPWHAGAGEEHAASCALCRRELELVRAERALFARRPAPPVSALWPRVADRIGAAQETNAPAIARAPAAALRRARWARTAAFASAVAACILYAVYAPRLLHAPAAETVQALEAISPKALAALNRAELDYRNAAKVLEAEYAQARPQLDPALAERWDAALAIARTPLGGAQTLAADDIHARLQIIDGYAGYVRSLRQIVEEVSQ